MSRIRILFLLATTLAIAAAFAACGGSNDSSSDVPPQRVLDQTFSDKSTINSGKMDVSLTIEASGEQSGNFQIDVSGPFDDNGSGDAKLDLTAKGSGDSAGQSVDFEAGAIFTGDAGYISWKDTDYKLSSEQYSSLTSSLRSSSQSDGQNQGSLPGLKDSLRDLTNEGETEVEGTNTIHVSGNVDPAKLSAAIRSAIKQGAARGTTKAQLRQLQGALPQLNQVSDSIKEASFDIYSGVDDHLLRKLDFNLEVAPRTGGEVKVTFDLTLSDVNEPQTVSAPSSSEPVENLLRQAAPLLGALQGQASPTTPSTGGGSTTPAAPAGGPNAAMLKCLQNATTAAEVQA
ncbi:MAG: hypothetical protein ACXWZM_11350, partial [Solirubrobacterales bacterium]